MALTPGRRYLGHYIGLASDGKPIYLVYCCVQSEEEEPDFPGDGAYYYDYYYGYQDSGPPTGDSGPGGGGGGSGGSCDDCLARLCVVRDSQGRIVDIFYRDVGDNYVRVPDCSGSEYYGSYSSGDSGGSGSGSGSGSSCGECLPYDLSVLYVADYDIEWGGANYSGTLAGQLWSGDHIIWIMAGIGECYFNSEPTGLGFFPLELGCRDGSWYFNFVLYCDIPVCTLDTDDVELTITDCPGFPTYTITIKPGRCIQGSFVIRPA